ncbi:hypothetical protein [Arsukibacterium indicum]|uniref:Uncharacterized protein n=1 Tax=Arsukibacterium indicum TaxID=2848612 RepID=A0ABS6MRC4_9GAMM|nr:hypothetical protein [Arsukibacterium indicum]MBV2130817.1 hypothetical protein [Arsukibacterium indicum]
MNRNRSFLLLACLVSLLGCAAATLVQPYDEKLLTGSEQFYRKAATIIEHSKMQSPTERPTTEDPSHPGHSANMENLYAELLIDTNILLLRALANSEQVDTSGQLLQSKITRYIDNALPSNCDNSADDIRAEFSSLTVKNFVDLKCLVVNWQAQHQAAPGKVLTQADWSRRHVSLVRFIVAIQQAEVAKLRQSDR